ncbi:MAG: TrkH family potassium uptake protein, partial [Bacteroidales bacterium]|nr:TrkH family potassium uptake protein [Bacteroidales bacterium]
MRNVLNFKLVFRVVSRILFIVTASMGICIGVAIIYSEPLLPFIFSALVSFTAGLILFILTGKQGKDEIIQRKEAVLAVTLSWVFIALAGCLTYLFSGAISNFIDAFFESVSGFTTTGSSILTDIESLPKSILFWRSLTHWIGGIGVIVLFIVIMPQLQMGG